MSFSRDIKKFGDKTKRAANNIFRGTALDLFGKIVKRTPVGNPDLWKSKPPPGYTGGRLRGHWTATLNKPSEAVDNGDDSQITISRAKIGDSIFIVNNLPYAGAVENGHSTQAPHGMVKITVAEFEHIVKMRNRNKKL